ncbi:hypothetical protein BJ322DRAFT_1162096 [Thelephora terrestris]|uniref:Uncharacterized protein n=1 Tax=Thelephora terrestris TaxID=56493 RepID=A0A9P6H7D8_9AGAM|nr:hypothetical protein BJ322DRAFT_1162096 [Thelephora terrestris]
MLKEPAANSAPWVVRSAYRREALGEKGCGLGGDETGVTLNTVVLLVVVQSLDEERRFVHRLPSLPRSKKVIAGRQQTSTANPIWYRSEKPIPMNLTASVSLRLKGVVIDVREWIAAFRMRKRQREKIPRQNGEATGREVEHPGSGSGSYCKTSVDYDHEAFIRESRAQLQGSIRAGFSQPFSTRIPFDLQLPVAGFLTPFFPKLTALALYTIPAGTGLSHLQINKAQALLSRDTPYPQTRTGSYAFDGTSAAGYAAQPSAGANTGICAEHSRFQGPAVFLSRLRRRVAWPTTNDHPEVIPALWYSVVSIWRLQTSTTRLEEDAKMLELWHAHTSAWLVVFNFAQQMWQIGYLTQNMIPSLEGTEDP